MNRLRLSWLWLGLGLALVATVWFLSLTPHPPSVDIQNGDKYGHLFAYASLMLWFGWLYPPRVHWRVALLFVLQGLLLELLQGLSGYRYADVYDMLANSLGVAIGWLLVSFSTGALVRLDALIGGSGAMVTENGGTGS
jgi:VanZ family protein